MRYTYSIVIIASSLLLSVLSPAAGRADELKKNNVMRPVFALVVGNNQTIEGQSKLRYADDDAVQNAAFAAQIGNADNVVLLTTLDNETADTYPKLHPKAPSKQNLHAAMKRLNRKMHAEKLKGAKPEFFLFYTGHGSIKNNAGYIALENGMFTRDDLLALAKGSLASRNHLIIDSCKSYFMVFERGPGGGRRQVTGKLVSKNDLPENTGVFLSTSSAANSHEWEAISAGVFSHEVRSALRGGADLDLNKKVTYEEAAAFIWNANRGIPIKKFRPVFYMQPPNKESADDSVLADLTRANGHWLHATPAKRTRQYIEDARGTRIAEFHPESSQNIAILIPKERPLFVRRPSRTTEFEIPPIAYVELTSLKAVDAEVLTRGAENLAFLELFAGPFGSSVLTEYHKGRKNDENSLSLSNLTVNATMPRDRGQRLSRTRNVIGLSSALLAGSGLAMTLLALKKHNDAPSDESNNETVKLNNTIHRLNVGAVTCYSIAAAAFTTWVIWTMIARKKARAHELKWSFGGLTLGRHF